MQNFDFYNRTMSGQQEPLPRWKRSVSTVSGVLGEAVGQMYVEKYFPAENKARMEELVKNLQEALAERIDAQEWMSDSTKAYTFLTDEVAGAVGEWAMECEEVGTFEECAAVHLLDVVG